MSTPILHPIFNTSIKYFSVTLTELKYLNVMRQYFTIFRFLMHYLTHF